MIIFVSKAISFYGVIYLQVRVSVSTSERAQLLEKMEPGHALVTADWAQKLLPMYSREKQSDYFGKSGISYHVTYTTANIGGELCSHTTVHIVGESTEQVHDLIFMTSRNKFRTG